MNLEDKYFSTEGRLNRKPLIYYLLFLIVMFMAFIGLAVILGVTNSLSIAILGENINDLNPFMQLEIISIIILLISLIGLIMLTMPLNFLMIRRLHDLNINGWWIVLPIIFPLGYIPFILYLICFKGTKGSNRYGDNPLDKD